MYDFGESEREFAFIDCFGFTVVSGVEVLGTKRQQMARDSHGAVSLSRDGSVVLSYSFVRKAVVWRLPELEPIARPKAGMMLALVPAGTHVLRFDRQESPSELEFEFLAIDRRRPQLPRRLDAIRRVDDGSRVELSALRAEATELAPIELGAVEPNLSNWLRIASDGTVLVYQPSIQTLTCLDLDGSELRPRWRRQLTTRRNAYVDIHADRHHFVITTACTDTWQVMEWDQTARVSRPRCVKVESLTPPVIAGPFFVTQPAVGRVVRRRFDADTMEEFAFDPGPDDLGPATIFAGPRGRLVVLCPDRERFVDLGAGVEFARRLNPAHAGLRRAALVDFGASVRHARRVGVLLELDRVEVDAADQHVAVLGQGWNSTHFGAGLVEQMCFAYRQVALEDGWTLRHSGGHSFRTYVGATCSELLQAYEVLDDMAVPFADTVRFLAQSLNISELTARGVPVDRAGAIMLVRALLSMVCEGADARPALAQLITDDPPSLDEVLDVFTAHTQNLTTSVVTLAAGLVYTFVGPEVLRLLLALVHLPWRGPFHDQDGGLWSLIRQHPELLPVLDAWLDANEADHERSVIVEQLRQELARRREH